MKFSLSATARLLALSSLAALSACAIPRVEPPPTVTPEPAPVPTPTPTPAPAPLPPPFEGNWIDAPQSPGNWFYRAVAPYSYAVFGASETDFDFVMRCDRANRTVSIGRVSNQRVNQTMRILTATTERQFTAMPRQGSIETLLAIDLPAMDGLLDAMAVTRGRFAVQVGGERSLYIPSWPELTRVIEDCR